MDAEEVGVENGSKNDLLDDDLREDGEEFGCEVEMVMQEHEPVRFLLVYRHWESHVRSGQTYQLYDGILDPIPTVKWRIVLHGSYPPTSTAAPSLPWGPDSVVLFCAGLDAFSGGKKYCALRSPNKYITIELQIWVVYGLFS